MEGNTCPVITPVPVESPKPPDSAATENRGSVSPKMERDSPEPNCAICLGKTENKSFTDSCLHQFCFNCLLEWSKVKAECPLCKQSFKSIIHNVRSNEDYDQYHLHLHTHNPEPSYWPEPSVVRVRYRTTMTADRQRERSIFDTLMTPLFLGTDAIPPQRNVRRRHRMYTSDFRALVYRDNLWVNPLPDVTGRYRECSPEFYRMNQAQIHRLAPWLNRELSVLRVPATHIMVVMDLVLSLITRFPITSVEFRSHVAPHLGANTDHFIHEFYAFARSPYDMMGFDQSAEYRERAPAYSHEVQPIDSDSDSDVVVLSSSPPPMPSTSHPPQLLRQVAPTQTTTTITVHASTSRSPPALSPQPGPSRLRTPDDLVWSVSVPRLPAGAEQSNAQSSLSLEVRNGNQARADVDDCVIVGYVKPRHERTPEIITLESDVETVNERISVEENMSDILCFSSTSNASHSDSSDSDFVPYQRAPVKKVIARKHKKMKKIEISSTDDSSDSPLARRKARISSSDSDSTEVSRCSKHKHKKSKSKGKKKRVTTVLDTSDEEEPEPQVRATGFRKSRAPVWRIVRKQEPETDHDYSLDHNDHYDPPYTEEEVAAFSSENRPKLRSIVITKSAGSSQRACSHSSVASSSRSSSHYCENRRHKHKSHKREDKKRRERRRSRSSSPVRTSRSKRSKKQRVYSTSDSSS